MKKRGQVTAFVIIGLIIVIVIGVAFYISSQALSKKGEKFGILSAEKEALEVQQYMTSCIDEALKNAVSSCSGNFPGGGPKCPNYEADIAEKTKDGFCNCIPNCNDFSMFKNVKVEAKGDIDLKAKLTSDKKKLTITMKYPILVKKDSKEHMIGTRESPFTAQYALEQSECAPVALKNNDYSLCEAAEEKTVEILGLVLTYYIGDKVAVGGACIAC